MALYLGFYDYRPMTYGASKQSSNMPPYGRTPKHKLSSIPQNAAYDEPLMVKDEKSTLEEKEQAWLFRKASYMFLVSYTVNGLGLVFCFMNVILCKCTKCLNM